MTDAFAPVASTASATVSNTGSPRCVEPPLPGVTPPTICVPYASACSEWKLPCDPVKPWQITLVLRSIRTAMSVCSRVLCDGGNDLVGRIGTMIGREDRQTGGAQNLLGEIDGRAFQTHDERHAQIDFARGADDAFRNHVAAHDAAEDIHEDRFDLR